MKKSFEIKLKNWPGVGHKNWLMYVKLVRKYNSEWGEHFRIDVHDGNGSYSYPKKYTTCIKREEAISIYNSEVDNIVRKYYYMERDIDLSDILEEEK